MKLMTDNNKQQSSPKLGVGSHQLTRDSYGISNNASGGATSNQLQQQTPSALQQKHLSHIVGSGRNSVHDVDGTGGRTNPFTGSNMQGPLAQRRQNTGQRIIENSSKSIRSTKALPLSSQGHNNARNPGNNDYSRGGAGIHPGIPKPTIGSAAHRRSNNRLPSNNQYNSTSAAGYQSKQNNNQQNRGTTIQNIQMRQKKLNQASSSKDPSHQLKMAGAASLQRDRDINSQSELGQIASGYKPQSSSNNSNIQPNNNQRKEFSGKNSVNISELHHGLPSNRQIGNNKPYSNAVSSASQNQRLIRNVSRSQVDTGSGINVQRDSISIDRKPLTNKMITNSQNGSAVNGQFHHQSTANGTPVGSMPLAQAIYGHSNHHNRNYRANKSKHADAKASLQSKRSHAGGPTSSNPNHSSVDHQRMQAFKNNMKEIQANVKRTEEVLSIIQNNSRNAAGNQASNNKSPTQRREQRNNGGELDSIVTGATSNSIQTVNSLAGINNNSGISRSRVKGLQNSHSNKRLPTWKAGQQNSLLGTEKGVSSPVFERGGIADRSLDRVSANAKGNLMSGGGIILQSRAELLQNEYKKVIENHPGTIQGSGVGGASKYDDTDFLSRMFTEKSKGQVEPLGLNRQDSSEVLHKSQSMKMIGESSSQAVIHNGGATSIQHGSSTVVGDKSQSSVAARMLARKQNILQQSNQLAYQQEQKSRDFSSEARKYLNNGSKESRKISNRGEGGITSSRNQKSQVSNVSMESGGAGAVSEFKPTSMFSVKELPSEVAAENHDLENDDDIRKITRLQLINASARYELLSANQQLLDFHLNRVMNTMFKKKQQRADDRAARAAKEAKLQTPTTGNQRISNLMNIEKSVIDEVSETEENNTTQQKIGRHFSNQNIDKSPNNRDPYSDIDKKIGHMDETARDRNRDSMFGTMLMTNGMNGMSKEHEARMIQMQDPHQVMQQRLNDMNPMMFGDTMRLPVRDYRGEATPEPTQQKSQQP